MPANYVYIFGCLKRRSRLYGLPKGAPFVVCVAEFDDTRQGRKDAHQYAKILDATSGYCSTVLWGREGSMERLGKVFYHRWFFN